MQKTHCHRAIGHPLKNRRSTFTPLLKFLPQGENSHRLKKYSTAIMTNSVDVTCRFNRIEIKRFKLPCHRKVYGKRYGDGTYAVKANRRILKNKAKIHNVHTVEVIQRAVTLIVLRLIQSLRPVR